MKTCSDCREAKPTSEFHRNRCQRDGLQNLCKPCQARYYRKWREANRDKKAEYGRRWLRANAKRASEYNREYREANAERLSEYYRKYREANYERKAEVERKWREANPDRVKTSRRKRRAAVRSVETMPYRDYDIYLRDKGLCGLCEGLVSLGAKYPDPMSLSIDHIVPISLGGGDTPDNVQVAHLRCNVAKGNRVAA